MIMLYRKGNTHVIRGVECEMGRFETNRLMACLNSGWVTSPQDLLEGEEAPSASEESAIVECSSDVTIKLADPIIEAFETIDEVEKFCIGDGRNGIQKLAADKIKAINGA